MRVIVVILFIVSNTDNYLPYYNNCRIFNCHIYLLLNFYHRIVFNRKNEKKKIRILRRRWWERKKKKYGWWHRFIVNDTVSRVELPRKPIDRILMLKQSARCLSSTQSVCRVYAMPTAYTRTWSLIKFHGLFFISNERFRCLNELQVSMDPLWFFKQNC